MPILMDVQFPLNPFLVQELAKKSIPKLLNVQARMPIATFAEENKFSQFHKSSCERLQNEKFTHWRKIRGDGNCFYRAFAFGYLENLLRHHEALQVMHFRQWLEYEKEPFCLNKLNEEERQKVGVFKGYLLRFHDLLEKGRRRQALRFLP